MDQFEVEASRLVEAEIARLRGLSHLEAALLPEAKAVDVVIAGKAASLTVFRYVGAKLPDGHAVVVALAARPQFLGMATRHLERGLVYEPFKAPRDATSSELASTLALAFEVNVAMFLNK